MKQFIVDRHTTPSTPSMDEVPNEKIPIYDNLADVTADLANLEVGQIVATKDTGTELSQPVDVVEEGNLHAVSSNAVYKALNEWEAIDTTASSGATGSHQLSEDLDNFKELIFTIRTNTQYAQVRAIRDILPNGTYHGKAFSNFTGGAYSAGQGNLGVYSGFNVIVSSTGTTVSWTMSYNDSNFSSQLVSIHGRR